MWHGEAVPRLGVQGVECSILVGALFSLEERKKKEKRKEQIITVGKDGFPVAGPALLAVQWIAAIRCN
jgi:hypothetical protein